MMTALKTIQKVVDIIVWFGLAFPVLMALATLAWAFQKIPPIRHFFCVGIMKVDKFLDGVARVRY